MESKQKPKPKGFGESIDIGHVPQPHKAQVVVETDVRVGLSGTDGGYPIYSFSIIPPPSHGQVSDCSARDSR